MSPRDTLDLLLQLDQVPEEGIELLLRVDSLEAFEEVRLQGTPPATAAATSLTLTTAAVFTVCVAEAPIAVVFQGEEAPHGKAWARVGAGRPVRGWVQTSGARGVPDNALVVPPGESGRRRFPAGHEEGS